MPRRRGFVHVYTGHGKGKTTAALGLAVRATGAGLKVCLIQFLKGQKVSEHKSLAHLPRMVVQHFGTGKFIQGVPSPRDYVQAANAYQALQRALQGEFDVVIADEICVAQALGLIQEADVLALLALRPAHVEFILTGRNASPKLQRAANLVTEMREKKHYLSQGITSRRGIES